MKRAAPFLLLPALFFAPGCKTSGSRAAAFSINGDPAAAQTLIVNTVIKYYPQVAQETTVLQAFAAGLASGNTAQAATSDYILQEAYKKMSSGDHNPTEFDDYVAQEFIALTNYASVLQLGDVKLAYTGVDKATEAKSN